MVIIKILQIAGAHRMSSSRNNSTSIILLNTIRLLTKENEELQKQKAKTDRTNKRLTKNNKKLKKQVNELREVLQKNLHLTTELNVFRTEKVALEEELQNIQEMLGKQTKKLTMIQSIALSDKTPSSPISSDSLTNLSLFNRSSPSSTSEVPTPTFAAYNLVSRTLS